MTNSVAVVNSEETPKCDGSIEDIEICEKGVHSIWSVDEEGSAIEHLEDYSMESFYAYYYCSACGDDWVINPVQDREQAWKLVKEHFNA